MRTFADFKFINIVDDANPYFAVLGIDRAIGNQTIINFKISILSFEYDKMRVVAPLDPLEGQIYIELVFNEGQADHLDNIYNVTALKEEYINLNAYGNLS